MRPLKGRGVRSGRGRAVPDGLPGTGHHGARQPQVGRQLRALAGLPVRPELPLARRLALALHHAGHRTGFSLLFFFFCFSFALLFALVACLGPRFLMCVGYRCHLISIRSIVTRRIE